MFTMDSFTRNVFSREYSHMITGTDFVVRRVTSAFAQSLWQHNVFTERLMCTWYSCSLISYKMIDLLTNEKTLRNRTSWMHVSKLSAEVGSCLRPTSILLSISFYQIYANHKNRKLKFCTTMSSLNRSSIMAQFFSNLCKHAWSNWHIFSQKWLYLSLLN